MLTRFVRIQLVIFTIVGTFGVAVMVFGYIQVPTLLGIGRITVTVELPAAGGLYRFSNVTYRGVQVGKVTAVELTRRGAKATLSLDTSPKIPANLQAEVRSISAVGEQYRRSEAAHRLSALPAGRLGHRHARHHDPAGASVRCSIRSVRWSAAFPRTSSTRCSMSRSRLQRGGLRPRVADRLSGHGLRRPQTPSPIGRGP